MNNLILNRKVGNEIMYNNNILLVLLKQAQMHLVNVFCKDAN